VPVVYQFLGRQASEYLCGHEPLILQRNTSGYLLLDPRGFGVLWRLFPGGAQVANHIVDIID
jgi:hypothetical protein